MPTRFVSLTAILLLSFASLARGQTVTAEAGEDFTDPAVRTRYLAMEHNGILALAEELDAFQELGDRYHQGKALLRELVWRKVGYETYEQDTARSLARIFQNSKNLDLRHYALQLFGEVGTRKSLQYLSFRLVERDFAKSAIQGLRSSPNARAGDILLSGFENDKLGLTESYVRALGSRRMVRAIPKIVPYLESEDQQLKLAAIAALGCMPDLSAIEALIPHTGDSTSETGMAAHYALRNVCRYLERAGRIETAVAAYRRIQKSVPTNDGQLVAGDGLAEHGGIAELELIGEVLPDVVPAQQMRFVGAAVAIGGRLDSRQDPDLFKKAYRACLRISPPGHALTVRLESRLRALGEGPVLEAVDGIFRRWWFFGSFPCASPEDWKVAHSPEQSIDLFARERRERGTTEWFSLTNEEPDGRVVLDRLFRPNDSAVAYAYVEFEMETAQDAELRTGSDDGLVVWFNGEMVFEHLEPRQYQPEQDRTPVRLRSGKNQLLLKICEATEEWCFAARLLDQNGNPVKFTIR